MANKYTKSSLSGFSEWLTQALAQINPNSPTYDIRNTYNAPRIWAGPAGNYSGSTSSYSLGNGGYLRNPWGVTANVYTTGETQLFGAGVNKILGTLAPGQSLDLGSGQLSDPNLHAGTAYRLNTNVQQRKVNEAGLQQAGATSARETKSVLASLDELYLGNTETQRTTSYEKSGLTMAKEQGFNTTNTKTILGTGSESKATVSAKVISL